MKKEKKKVEEKHVHYWVIDIANGPVSTGRCKCGETREFLNAFPDYHLLNKRPTLSRK